MPEQAPAQSIQTQSGLAQPPEPQPQAAVHPPQPAALANPQPQVSPVDSSAQTNSSLPGPKKSNRKLIIALVAGLLALVGAALVLSIFLNKDSIALSTYTFETRDTSYTISYPEGWDTSDGLGFVSFTEDGDGTGDYEAKISLLTDNISGTDKDTYFDEVKELLKERFEEQDESDDIEYFTDLSVSEVSYGKYDVLLLEVDINNFGEEPGESGKGMFAVVYVGDELTVTLVVELHSEDTKYLDAVDDMVESIKSGEGSSSED